MVIGNNNLSHLLSEEQGEWSWYLVLNYYNCKSIVTVACIHSKQQVSDFVLLQLVVRGLLSSLKSIGSILFYDLLIITVFAVIGTQIFKVLVLHMCVIPYLTVAKVGDITFCAWARAFYPVCRLCMLCNKLLFFLQGRFRYCTDPMVRTVEECQWVLLLSATDMLTIHVIPLTLNPIGNSPISS